MFNFCLYSEMFGKVGKGLHRFRGPGNIAIVDVVMTIILAYVFKLYFVNTHYGLILVLCFLLGIFAHRLFCVKTTVDKILFQ